MTTIATQPQKSLPYPEQGWQNWALKAPLLLWRLGLGSVVGKIIMVITTTGHKSHQPSHTMAKYYTLGGKKYVICANGEKAAWYKNIKVDPRVTVQTAEGIENMWAVRVTNDEELRQVIELFRRQNAPLTNRYTASLGINSALQNLPGKKGGLYVLRFDPTTEPTPPGLKADLEGIWPVAGAGLALLLVLWIRK